MPLANLESQPSSVVERILARDRLLDGQLVFGVTTTCIYCRPSCPSRRPRAEHIRLFDAPKEAEGAGFRPCKRCQPEAALTREAALVRDASRLFAKPAPERWNVGRLAQELQVSSARLQRAFRHETGLTAHAFFDARRRETAARALQSGASVRLAARRAGFRSPQALYRNAQRDAFPPNVPRPTKPPVAVQYGIFESELGFVLVATTSRGLCAVRLGADRRQLEREVRQEFPTASATLQAGDDDWRIAEVLRRVAGASAGRSLPLDVRATAFQRRVWQELQSIPHGSTITYAELARRVERPLAARAVARACATNPLAVVVPCHRVVATNGAVAGYRWGLGRKQHILAKEADVRDG